MIRMGVRSTPEARGVRGKFLKNWCSEMHSGAISDSNSIQNRVSGLAD